MANLLFSDNVIIDSENISNLKLLEKINIEEKIE